MNERPGPLGSGFSFGRKPLQGLYSIRGFPFFRNCDSSFRHPAVVITGSVNSDELTLFDPVIHAWRP